MARNVWEWIEARWARAPGAAISGRAAKKRLPGCRALFNKRRQRTRGRLGEFPPVLTERPLGRAGSILIK